MQFCGLLLFISNTISQRTIKTYVFVKKKKLSLKTRPTIGAYKLRKSKKI